MNSDIINNNTVGILLAGGLGSRMYPSTKSISKHLLPLYDKPIIYYSFSILLLAGIKNIIIISSREDTNNYKKIFGNGSQLGIKIKYLIQNKPNGIAEALLIAKKYIISKKVVLMLGDNFIHGHGLPDLITESICLGKSIIFGHRVSNPKDYGVAKFNSQNKLIKIIEKPKKPPSDLAVIGLYIFGPDWINFINKIKPSKRNELEITDLNNLMIKDKKMELVEFGRGFYWMDCGTPDNLLKTSIYVQNIQERQNTIIACIEEIVFRNKWISINQYKKLINLSKNSAYKKYLESTLKLLS